MKWPTLAVLQAEYAATDHELERRAIAVTFERAVRELAEDHEDAERRAVAEAELLAIVHGEPVEIDDDEIGLMLDRWDQTLAAREMLRAGLSRRAIAKRLGVLRWQVSKMLAELD